MTTWGRSRGTSLAVTNGNKPSQSGSSGHGQRVREDQRLISISKVRETVGVPLNPLGEVVEGHEIPKNLEPISVIVDRNGCGGARECPLKGHRLLGIPAAPGCFAVKHDQIGVASDGDMEEVALPLENVDAGVIA